jgi:hypothetical protein
MRKWHLFLGQVIEPLSATETSTLKTKLNFQTERRWVGTFHCVNVQISRTAAFIIYASTALISVGVALTFHFK